MRKRDFFMALLFYFYFFLHNISKIHASQFIVLTLQRLQNIFHPLQTVRDSL